MDRITKPFLKACLGLIPIIGIGWIFAIPDRVGYAFTFQQVVVVLVNLLPVLLLQVI